MRTNLVFPMLGGAMLLATTANAQDAAPPPAAPAPPPTAPVPVAAPVPAAEQPAADEGRYRNGFAMGINLNRFHDDFGLSALFASPSIAKDMFRIVLAGGLAWYTSAVNGNGDNVWLPYYHGRLVLESGTRIKGTPIRLYGVGGVVAIFTPSRLSGDVVHPGGYGGFGFEFFFQEHGDGPAKDAPVSYHIELGGIGTGTQADNLPGKPIIANGFLATVGFRFYP
jgi:hypothetical protein